MSQIIRMVAVPAIGDEITVDGETVTVVGIEPDTRGARVFVQDPEAVARIGLRSAWVTEGAEGVFVDTRTDEEIAVADASDAEFLRFLFSTG